MNISQGPGFLGMLLGGLVGRGAQAIAGRRPLDWASLPLPGLDGGALSPALFAGRVVLVVNTASGCVFAAQLGALQRLWQEREAAGLTILGVPSNDFAQERRDAAALRGFCDRRHHVAFPLLAKQAVLGPQAHPIYRWAAAEGGPAAVPKWNFHKLLVGRDGRLLGSFSAAVGAGSRRLATALDEALAA